MKRSGFIARKTPLRSGSRLKRTTRLAKVSPRRREENSFYKIEVKAHLKEFPLCQVGDAIMAAGYPVRCTRVAKHVHHRKGRAGPLFFDRRWFFSCCDGECHPQWTHQTHVKEATELGIILTDRTPARAYPSHD